MSRAVLVNKSSGVGELTAAPLLTGERPGKS
jgi:hypothetical protein